MKNVERLFIRQEVTQREEEGCDVGDLRNQVETAVQNNDSKALNDLYDGLDALEPTEKFAYDEPSTLAEIRQLRPDGPRRVSISINEEDLYNRIYGGWLGRAAGCSLGKPVEGWPRERIDEYLETHQALPLENYLPFDGKFINEHLKSSTLGNIEFMARDDDMDFPILGLIALEERGTSFTSRGMSNVWMSYMPANLLYTAERAAYRNFTMGHMPPDSASYRNPFREWIGAQIRADIFGYVTPGWPEKAAELAFKDASISHVKNGIYGEMFVAAILAGTYMSEDIVEIINIGLSEIPEKCRLAEAINKTLSWCQELNDWEAVWTKIKAEYGHYSGVHTINNAALVVLGLYFGTSDFEKGIVISVRSGWDTDCNGATVGSILGLKNGAKGLPSKWIGVLNDRLMSSVREFNDNKISELARRTSTIAQQILALPNEELGTAYLSKDADDNPFIGKWIFDLGFDLQTVYIEPDLSCMQEDQYGQRQRLDNAKIEGRKVSFDFIIEKAGFGFEAHFEGELSGNTIQGTGSGSGFDFEMGGERS